MAQGLPLVTRDRFALIIIDTQERLAAAMERREPVVANAVKLAKAAALLGAPIIVTRQYPKGLGDTVPELTTALDTLAADGARIETSDKTVFNCWEEPDFTRRVGDSDCDQFVLAGMETHICVAQTALSLYEEGFSVHVAADACCSRDPANHEIALERMRAAGIAVTAAESVMYEAVGRAATDEFKQLLAIVKGDN